MPTNNFNDLQSLNLKSVKLPDRFNIANKAYPLLFNQ